MNFTQYAAFSQQLYNIFMVKIGKKKKQVLTGM